jgi:hypothetical protein
VEQIDTTTVIPPGVIALVDPVGNLHLRRDPRPEDTHDRD